VGALAGALIAVGAVVLVPSRGPISATWLGASTIDGTEARIGALRARTERVPGDWVAWAQLGLGYLERARATGNPAWYGAAEAALPPPPRSTGTTRPR
jgi:hypothetical protein